MPHNDPVVIAGAGPVGLVTALALARRQVPVRVVETEPALTRDLRAGSFHPPTLDMLADLGVGEDMHKDGIVVRHWQYRDRFAGVVAEFDLGLLQDETRHPYRLHLEQHRLTPILLQHLERAAGNVVSFGTALTDTRQRSEMVEITLKSEAGEETIRTPWLIAADGGRSTVRKSTGVTFEGFTWPERFLVASTVRDLEPLGYAYNAYVADPDLWSAVFKVPDDGPPGLWRIAYPTDPDEPEEDVLAEEMIQDKLRQLIPEGAPYELKYRSTYRVHQRVADRFNIGRILLAGDAAHINNPLGGLGLNGGIHDAVNLAEKLAEIWHGRADIDLLELYDRQRRPINVEHIQKQSIRNKRMMEARDPETRKQRNDEMAAIAANPVRAKAHLMNTSMINSVRDAAAVT